MSNTFQPLQFFSHFLPFIKCELIYFGSSIMLPSLRVLKFYCHQCLVPFYDQVRKKLLEYAASFSPISVPNRYVSAVLFLVTFLCQRRPTPLFFDQHERLRGDHSNCDLHAQLSRVCPGIKIADSVDSYRSLSIEQSSEVLNVHTRTITYVNSYV